MFKTIKEESESITGSVACFVPYLCYVFASGQYKGYRPLSIMIADAVLKSGFPANVLGMSLIAVIWGFFEGFNYVVISDKLNRRYPSKNQWADIGAITCAVIGILFHPLSTSFWGIYEEKRRSHTMKDMAGSFFVWCK